MSQAPRRKERNPDPLRAAWLAGDFALALDILRLAQPPLATTCRRILAPRRLLVDLRSEAWGSRKKNKGPSYSQALTALARRLPEALRSNPSIAGQMRANASIRLLASELAGSPFRFGAGDPAKQAEFEDALFGILALIPGGPCLPGIAGAVIGARPEFCFSEKTPPLWALAPRLPGAAAERLLALAELSAPLDPGTAWAALRDHGRGDPAAIAAAALRARSADPIQVARLCTQLAIDFLGERTRHPVEAWLAASRIVCERHADLPGALSCAAIIGSARPIPIQDAFFSERARWVPDYSHVRPQPFSIRDRDAREWEPTGAQTLRARRFLGWLDGCALLCARLGLPDIAAPHLANRHLEKAYESLREAVQKGLATDDATGFGARAPSLVEAFNARKLALSLKMELPAGSLPKRPRSI